MKITILGTSNAWGVNPFYISSPMAGSLSSGKKVEIRKYRTSILIESCKEKKKILIDCGPDFSHQLREFRFGVVDAILITHPHFDHIGGLDDLNLYSPTGRLPIPTYATEDCWKTLENDRGFGYVIGNKLIAKTILCQKSVPWTFSIDSIKVTPFLVEHHHTIAPGAVGFVFEETINDQVQRILYSGDFWAFSNPTDPLFSQQYDIAIIECDRWSGLAGPLVKGGHMSFDEVIRVLENGTLSNPKPKQVIFVHFGDNGPKGTSSSYFDWREGIIRGLNAHGLNCVMPNQDIVVGYEGLSL